MGALKNLATASQIETAKATKQLVDLERAKQGLPPLYERRPKPARKPTRTLTYEERSRANKYLFFLLLLIVFLVVIF